MNELDNLSQAIPFDEARELVETFFFDMALEAESADRAFAELALVHPETSAAALSYLEGRYVQHQPAVEPWESLAALPWVLARMIGRGGAAAQGELVGLSLRVADTADLRTLGEVVARTVEVDLLARLLLAGLDRDTATQFRAAELAYQSIDASGGVYVPSADLELVLNERLRLFHRREARSVHAVQ